MAENKLEKFIAKQKTIPTDYVKFLVKVGAIMDSHLDSDVVFLRDPELDVISSWELDRIKKWNLTIESLIYACSHNDNYKKCDTIRIYYPTEDVAKAFIKFLQYYIKEFRDKKIKIYNIDNYEEFVRRSSLENKTYQLKDTLYITEDDVEVVKNDLCINLKELEMPTALVKLQYNESGYKNNGFLTNYIKRDFTTIDFTKEFKEIINGEYTPKVEEKKNEEGAF